MGKSFKFKELEKEAGSRINGIVGEKLQKPLSPEEVSRICHVPFDIMEEKIADPVFTRVKTPLGDFTKYNRSEYSIFDPRIKGKVVVKAAVKLKFVKLDDVQVKVNR